MRRWLGGFFLVLLCAEVPMQAMAWPSDSLWTRTYGGTSYDGAYSIDSTGDGGYVIAGYTRSFGAGNDDAYLLRIDASGDTLWTRTYGGTSYDEGLCVRSTSDGGFIVAGYTKSLGDSDGDFYAVKTDSAGGILWVHTYGADKAEEACCVREVADHGYIFAGMSLSFGFTRNMYVVRTDSLGDTLWTRAYGTSNDYEDACCVEQTDDGGFIVAGSALSSYYGKTDMYLVRTDSLGDTLWTRRYPDSDTEQATCTSMHKTGDGGYVLAGFTAPAPDTLNLKDFCLVKISEDGNVVWDHVFAGECEDCLTSVIGTADGGVVVAGHTNSFPACHYDDDVYVQRCGDEGCVFWYEAYGGVRDQQAYAIQETGSGDYIVVGQAYLGSSRRDDVYVLKVEGGESAMAPGSSECNPLIGEGPPTDQEISLPPPPPDPIHCITDDCCCHDGSWPYFWWPISGGPRCHCGTYVHPPYVDHFDYSLDSLSIADSVTFGGCIIPTGFFGVDIETDAGDSLVDEPERHPLEFNPGVTHFTALDIPLLLDMETFEGDEFPLGIWFNNPDSVAIDFRVQVLSEWTEVLDQNPTQPLEFRMTAPMPNPTTRTVSFSIDSAKSGPLEIRVVDVRGRLVRTIHKGTIQSGEHRFEWNIRDENDLQIAPGVYFLVAEGVVHSVRKTVVIR